MARRGLHRASVEEASVAQFSTTNMTNIMVLSLLGVFTDILTACGDRNTSSSKHVVTLLGLVFLLCPSPSLLIIVNLASAGTDLRGQIGHQSGGHYEFEPGARPSQQSYAQVSE